MYCSGNASYKVCANSMYVTWWFGVAADIRWLWLSKHYKIDISVECAIPPSNVHWKLAATSAIIHADMIIVLRLPISLKPANKLWLENIQFSQIPGHTYTKLVSPTCQPNINFIKMQPLNYCSQMNTNDMFTVRSNGGKINRNLWVRRNTSCYWRSLKLMGFFASFEGFVNTGPVRRTVYQ